MKNITYGKLFDVSCLYFVMDIEICITLSEFLSDFSNINNSTFSDLTRKCIFLLRKRDIALIFCM